MPTFGAKQFPVKHANYNVTVEIIVEFYEYGRNTGPNGQYRGRMVVHNQWEADRVKARWEAKGEFR